MPGRPTPRRPGPHRRSGRPRAAAPGADLSVPALLPVGDADRLADRDALTRTAEPRSRARLSVVRGARHGVLDDVNHRSVAAGTVAFPETPRTALVPVEPSTW
ncbi:hypothetical protein ACH4VX_11825 [Streptomyces sp. NPDC020731]|uniref:hypothetical protein n=1 Tax=Streptomyces sp. NPDC020731 TaxID=3365085 RepID=UPI0037ABF1F0